MGPVQGRIRRVAVTGLGVKAPGGTTPAALWATLRAGVSVAAPIASFRADGLPVTIACEVRGFDPSDYLGADEVERLDRAVHLAVGAASDAVAQADLGTVSPDRCGVAVGAGLGGVHALLREFPGEGIIGAAATRPSRFGISSILVGTGAALVGERLGWAGPNLTLSTACASGANAIGEAARLVRSGVADVMVAGGAEAPVTPLLVALFSRLGALSVRNGEPRSASRPFDRGRDGFVLAEGAGFLVLEDWARAEGRGAGILAEVVGYGRNSDAAHITRPSAAGAGAAACMQLALSDAAVPPPAVGHISAHGTGTTLNDDCELQAILRVFGPAPPPVTGPKSVLGHMLGAAGAVEAVAAILAIEHGEIPPTANLVDSGAPLGVDVVAQRPRHREPGLVMCNSFGFGGHNATLLFGACAPQARGGVESAPEGGTR